MFSPFIRLVAIAFLMMLFLASKAQTQKNLHGIISRQGTSNRIENVNVRIKNTINSLKTNALGEFSIPVSIGDTLEISHEGYVKQEFIVSNFADAMIFLQVNNVLPLVVIRGTSVAQELREAQGAFRSKGIYFKGKPPLALLLPFGGSPLTFVHELLGKDGKQARRFNEYATRTIDEYDVAARFNDTAIKRVVSISDNELIAFKSAYTPTAEQIRNWNDFDLFSYIKKSYAAFTKNEK
jgi:hypothetical protein